MHSYHVANLAIDGDFTTKSSTLAGWDRPLWYEMHFDNKHCFSEIVIVQSDYINPLNGRRMDDAKIFVVDNSAESICGILEIKEEWTIRGQTYRIPCNMKCGNEVKVTLLHERGKHGVLAAIHMREILAYSHGLFN